MSSPAVFTDSGATVTRSRKIRIYPDKETYQLLKRFLGLSRHWYNLAVDELKKPGTRSDMRTVRQLQKEVREPWEMDCPQRVREHAMADAVQAVKAAKARFGREGRFHEVKWRTKRDRGQRFGFDRQSLSPGSLFRGKYNIRFKQAEPLPDDLLEGCKLTFDGRHFHLVICVKAPIRQPETQRLPVVALDPGVRTFITFYGEDGVGKFGEGDFRRVYRLCRKLDSLYGMAAKAKCRRKRGFKRAAAKLRYRIRNLVDDLHRKTAAFLTDSFDAVLIPTFESSQMVKHGDRRIRSKTARSMLTWAHFRFKQFLKHKAELKSVRVIEVNEAYTSKTCSYCGRIHNIGSRKVLTCACGVRVDRDFNGARGILLRALAATPTQELTRVIC
jgi:putative transposase